MQDGHDADRITIDAVKYGVGEAADEHSAETAMEDWLRGGTIGSPARAEAHWGQLQFHWGRPPPAEEPRTMTVRGIGES